MGRSFPGAPAHRRLPDAQDDHLETSSTSTCCSLHYLQSCKEFIDAARAHVGESCSMPSSAVGSVGNDKGAVYCFLFIPPSVAWAAGLSRWGYPPLNPGRPPERAGESTRTPLISPEKLALPRPARGATLASSLTGPCRGTEGELLIFFVIPQALLKQAHAQLLGLVQGPNAGQINFWVGACGTRCHGPQSMTSASV